MKGNKINPFPLSGYKGAEFFCDREKELEQLTLWIKGGVPAVVIGIRRLGKTGLIRHLFHHLDGHHSVFVDLQGTEQFSDLVSALAESIARTFPESAFQKIWNALKNLRPTVEFEPYTNLPQISFEFKKESEAQKTLHGLFSMLSSLNQNVIIAFDEFQQIAQYPEANVEGQLRMLMQEFNDVNYLFSGSQTSLLTQMFSTGSRPFFGSSQRLYLEKIDADIYGNFIKQLFVRYDRKISLEVVSELLDWCEGHTYYVQFMCNQLFSEGIKTITGQDVHRHRIRLLQISRQDYFQWRDVLPSGQWRMMVAIAKEEELYKPTSKEIQRTYNLPTPNAIKKAISSLLTYQLINEFYNAQGEKFYKLADVFLMRFIQSEIKI